MTQSSLQGFPPNTESYKPLENQTSNIENIHQYSPFLDQQSLGLGGGLQEAQPQ